MLAVSSTSSSRPLQRRRTSLMLTTNVTMMICTMMILLAMITTMTGRYPTHRQTVVFVSGFSLSMSSSSMPLPKNMGCAAKPFEKKKVCVFGAGGYLGGCVYGMLQRAGSLYGTGISGVAGSPRAVVATSAGSVALNGILSKNFVLAQADESFVRVADMTSIEAVQEKIRSFDAAVLATRCVLEDRPVTLGTYEKTPNDKTKEFYMDQPRGSTIRGVDDIDYSMQLFRKTVEASSLEGVRHLVVVETDLEFDNTPAGDKYLDVLNEVGVRYTYIRPMGDLQKLPNFTYITGVQQDLSVSQGSGADSRTGTINREDLAALCVQSLMTLDWTSSRILQVAATDKTVPIPDPKSVTPAKEWCVNSDVLRSSLAAVM
mmetsp:Transcript_14190/g.34194  ORF Transcript_14190/g.34194 Transcript_14190/m.34194 type:complete len:373 (+) Transcript_14190:118-1236(+)